MATERKGQEVLPFATSTRGSTSESGRATFGLGARKLLMKFTGCRILFVVAFALTVAACQSEDKGPQPRLVSRAPYAGTAAPSSATAMAAQSSQNRQYFIEFRSRYALSYGHTYVIFGRADKNGNMINPEVAGLHPASDSEVPYVLGHFVPVPAETGWSDGDTKKNIGRQAGASC
jgi:hypothetical protein